MMDDDRTKADATGTVVDMVSAIGMLAVALVVLLALALTDWSGDRDLLADRDPSASLPLRSDPVPTDRAGPAINAAEWITNDDYPLEALRRGEEGRVTIRLDMAATGGRPLSCTVTASDASSSLERATCRALMRSARFAPQDAPFSFSRSVQWRLPTD